MKDASRDPRPCPTCGALNGPDFARCIRCGGAMAPLAGASDALSGRVAGESLPATKAIIALTLIIFALHLRADLAQHVSTPGGKSVSAVIMSGGLTSVAYHFGAIGGGEPLAGLAGLRLFSAVFVHYGLIHLGMNMLGLTNFARVAETVLGSARFLLGYVLTGVAGFALSCAWNALLGRSIDTAGASGAVFGVVGLVLGVLIRRRDPRWRQLAVQAVFWLVVSSAFGRINNAAHLGGALAGVALGFMYREHDPRPRAKRSDLLMNVAAALAALTCVVSLAAAQLTRPPPSGLSVPYTPDPDVLSPPRQPKKR